MTDGLTEVIFWIQGTRMPWFNTCLGPKKKAYILYMYYISYMIYILYISNYISYILLIYVESKVSGI